MNKVRDLPDRAERWLRHVSRRLGSLDRGQREDIIEGLRSHLSEILDAGEPIDDVLARIGSPKVCAAKIISEQRSATGEDLGGYRLNAKRIFQFAAFVLTAGAVLAALVLPGYTTMTSDSAGHVAVGSRTLLEVSGPGVIAVMAVPFLLALAPLLARANSWKRISAFSAALLLAFAAVAWLSIGRYFAPGAVIAVIAAFMPTGIVSSISHDQQETHRAGFWMDVGAAVIVGASVGFFGSIFGPFIMMPVGLIVTAVGGIAAFRAKTWAPVVLTAGIAVVIGAGAYILLGVMLPHGSGSGSGNGCVPGGTCQP